MTRRKLLGAAGAAMLLAGCAAAGGPQQDKAVSQQDKVVYHFSSGLAQASNRPRNIGNHLEGNPNAKIVVVSHALGVDFLMKGAKDKNGAKYEDVIERLKSRGVQFDVCLITLRNRKLAKE